MADIFDRIATPEGDIFDRIETPGVIGFTQKIFDIGRGERPGPEAGAPIKFPPTFEPAAPTGRFPPPKSLLETLTPRKVAGAGLPILGDILAARFAPQVAIPKQAARIAKVGISLKNLITRGAAAGGGSFLGSLIGQKIEKGDISLKTAGTEALLGFGGETILSPAIASSRFILRQSANIAKDLTISGNRVKSFISNQLIDKTTNRASRFVDEIAPDIVVTQEGAGNIGRQIEAALDENKLVYGRFKAVLDEAAGGEDGAILIDDLSQFLSDSMKQADVLSSKNPIIENKRRAAVVIKDLGFKINSPQARQLRKIMVGGLDSITPNEIEFIFTNVFPKKNKEFFKLTPDTQGAREELKAALIDDVAKITSGATGENAADIKKAGDEIFKTVKQFEGIKRVYDQAIITDAKTGASKIQPQKLADLINRNSKFFKQNMLDIWPKLKAEADFYEGIARRLKLGETGGIRDIGQIIGPGSLFLFGGLKGTVAVELFGAGSAWALLSDSGRATIRGFQKVPTKAILKGPLRLGGRELFNQEQ